jgi:heme/copper-type cytochrome/quinol oxidase subunit 1
VFVRRTRAFQGRIGHCDLPAGVTGILVTSLLVVMVFPFLAAALEVRLLSVYREQYGVLPASTVTAA